MNRLEQTTVENLHKFSHNELLTILKTAQWVDSEYRDLKRVLLKDEKLPFGLFICFDDIVVACTNLISLAIRKDII